ncbi:MAG: hypothetical protein HGB10_01285 [Coriobacteriia bacterium]|nr:hypothetical protein [Coriobacteriia bacterium]
MPWSVEYHPDSRIIETRYEGVMSPEELTLAVQTTIEAAHTNGTSLLFGDCSELSGGHSLADLYFLAESVLPALTEGAREAVLMPHHGESTEKVEFWETTCRNRGIHVRIFKERAEALAWLTG